MTLKTIREMREAAPFKPFNIHLTSGKTLPVTTSDHLFFIPDSREFLVALPGGGFHFVDPLQIESISGVGGPASQ